MGSSMPEYKDSDILIEYELNSLLGASHLVDYISVHIRFDLERYLLIICYQLFQSLYVLYMVSHT